MIRYLQNSEIDYNKWDACIGSAINGNLYAWSWYLDIISEGWCALVHDDYEAVMPLTFNKKYGISYLYQPAFSQQLGVFSPMYPAEELVNAFLEELTRHYRFAEINLSRFNKPGLPSFKVNYRKNYELELISEYHQLAEQYSSNTARNIKKARNAGIHLQENVDPKSIVNMFRHEKGKEIHQLKAPHYQMLEKIIYQGIHKRIANIYGAYDRNNQLCAGVFLLESHHRLVFLFSANNQTARASGVMALLVDYIINQFSGKPLTLDFEGSEIPGLARFYAGFGSVETKYPALHYNRLPLALRAVHSLLKAARR
jgi:hypothetical protein